MIALRSLMTALPYNPAERRRAWAGAFAPYFDMAPKERDPAPGLLALTRHRFEALTLFEMTAPAQTFRRTPVMAAGQALDHLMVLFWLDGEGRVTWHGGTAAFGRLQGVVLNLAQPATLVVGPVQATGLVLPRALVGDRLPDLAALHGAVLDLASDPVSRLFFTSVQDLAENASAVRDDMLPQVTRAIATVAAAALCRLTAVCPTAIVPAPKRLLEEVPA